MPANGVRVRAAIRTWVAWVSALLAALNCCSLSVTGGISAAGLCGSSSHAFSRRARRAAAILHQREPGRGVVCEPMKMAIPAFIS